MVESGIVIAYVLGYLIMWRKIVGGILHEYAGGYDIDGVDVTFGMLIGTIATFFWPAIVAGRLIYVAAKKHGSADGIYSFFPAPKPIETKAESRARKAAEQEAKIRQRQQQINAAERENGLPLTVWTDNDLRNKLRSRND